MTDHLTAGYNNLLRASTILQDAAPVAALLQAFTYAQNYVLAASSTLYGDQLAQIEGMRGDLLALQGRMAALDSQLQQIRDRLADSWPG